MTPPLPSVQPPSIYTMSTPSRSSTGITRSLTRVLCSSDFVAEDARDVYIHTVDAPSRDASEPVVRTETHASYRHDPIPDSCWLPEIPADWPGVLCGRCLSWMQQEGYTSLLDFRFARHPKCPRCRAERTQRALYGELAHRDIPPWLDPRGCCRTSDDWTCAACGLKW